MKLYLTYQTFVKTQQTMTFYPTAREVIVVCVGKYMVCVGKRVACVVKCVIVADDAYVVGEMYTP